MSEYKFRNKILIFRDLKKKVNNILLAYVSSRINTYVILWE